MRRALIVLALALALCGALAGSAAAVDLDDFDVTFTTEGGEEAMGAGQHPFALTTSFHVATEETEGGTYPTEAIKDLRIAQVPGLAGNVAAVPRCEAANFLMPPEGGSFGTGCPDGSAVGTVKSAVGEAGETVTYASPVYSLKPPPGYVAELGFRVVTARVVVPLRLTQSPPYRLEAEIRNISQGLEFFTSEFTIWGNPAAKAHDPFRGKCLKSTPDEETGELISRGDCKAGIPEAAFLVNPRACEGPLATAWQTVSWDDPTKPPAIGDALTHSATGAPRGFAGCVGLPFAPSISAQPTAKAGSSPSGLDFGLDLPSPGYSDPPGHAAVDIERVEVTLPEGMSINPSQAEGLEICTEADLARESATSEFGEGCPAASKIGSIEIESPALPGELLKGSLFVAKPYENPFGSMIAFYIVIKDPDLGISVVQPARVESDPVTGQLTTVTEDMPQVPFSHFRLHFKEGARSPLVTPSACGSYDVEAKLYPWSEAAPPVTSTSTFQIISGPNSSPCPKGGLPPFKPDLSAGTLNNRAGSFSDFNLRLSRTDSEQEITHFSIKLPPGITGKLAGIPYCSDADIQKAKERTGPHGGQEELDNPSCPAASQIGTTLAGAGVGPSLTYAPGKVYLAGPYHGSNLSMVAITAGVVGPFDIGTVVIREGFKIDPETAEVFIDSTGSDPIPHIINGIPVHLRDIRAYVNRPEFTLNPTDCTRTSTASTVLGSGLDFVSEADDNPITVTSPFQAADCAALRFKPQLGLRLKGGTSRGAHPAFSAHLQMTGIGEAGIARAEVTLPRSEFIENAHFKTICTRVQFKAGAGNGAECPADSIYGKATAVTPILGEALTGPVFLRSSEHQLPDLVVALHNSQVDFDLVGHVDSVKGGGLRNTFEAAPDAPVSSFDLEMAGGKKGLFVNSTNLCARTYRAKAVFTGQNGKVHSFKPKMQAKCKKKRKHKKERRGRGRHARHERALRIHLARWAER